MWSWTIREKFMKKSYKFYCTFENYFHILFLLMVSNEYMFDRQALLKIPGTQTRTWLSFGPVWIEDALIGLNLKRMHRS